MPDGNAAPGGPRDKAARSQPPANAHAARDTCTEPAAGDRNRCGDEPAGATKGADTVDWAGMARWYVDKAARSKQPAPAHATRAACTEPGTDSATAARDGHWL